MAEPLFNNHFTMRVVLDNGNTARLSGEVYDVAGYPQSVTDKAKAACAESVGPPSLYDNAKVTLRKNKNPERRIKIVHEPPMEGIENCWFCRQPTRWWNKKHNQPVCPECATTHTQDELTKPQPPPPAMKPCELLTQLQAHKVVKSMMRTGWEVVSSVPEKPGADAYEVVFKHAAGGSAIKMIFMK